MTDQKNTILAIVLSALVLIAWQYFVGLPQMEKQKQEAQLKAQQQQQQVQTPASSPASRRPRRSPAARSRNCPAKAPPRPPGQQLSREAVLKASPRVRSRRRGCAARSRSRARQIDDLALTQYRETVDPNSPPIVLLSPAGSPHPFYAEFGWVGGAGAPVKAPDSNTVWTQQGSGALGVDKPVTLTWDNGEGLEFRRIISIDDKYLFTVEDQVANKSAAAGHALSLRR